MTNKLKSFIQVLSSNFVVIILGIISAFIIPAKLEPTEFGYWQVYILYSSYVGLFILGYCDGIYLKYGGTQYNKLSREKFSGLFFILFFYTIIIAFLIIMGMSILSMSAEKRFILTAVAICIIFQCCNSFFILLNQATARFKIYSIGNIIEKCVLIVSVSLALIFSNIDFRCVIILSVLSKGISLIYNVIMCKDIIFCRLNIKKTIFIDVINNIKCGLPLTISGIVAMLITGFGKIIVEQYLSIEEFGYYSFSFPIMSLILQVILAVSIVLYPMMKNSSEKKLKYFESITEELLIMCTPIILFGYYFIRIIISYIMPKYIPSLLPIMILFPTLIYQCRINVVYNTLYKVKNMEKNMLYNSILSILFCIIITSIFFILYPSVFSIALTTLITYYFWFTISKYKLSKINKVKIKYFDGSTYLIIIYLIFNQFLTDKIALILFIFITIIFYRIYYMKIKKIIRLIITQIRKRENT